ncbi:exonuclease SbcCD subunit D [bacterium]|nr:exonuclease SbcCD subunit D [bacterium]
MLLLHTSDWHIGRQFHGISLLEDQAIVLEQIIAIARDRKVDAVLVAGDIYDRSVPPAGAVALLDNVFDRICSGLEIPVILISGNHDGPERLSFGSRQLAGSGLYICGSLADTPQPIILEDRYGPVAFYGIPYTDPATVRNLFSVAVSTHEEALSFILSKVKENHTSGHRSVVLSHVFLDGGETSESERPLSIGGLDQVSADHFSFFNYAALGHLHGRQHKGTQTIRYSGSILKYSFSEEHHQKGITLVDMDEKGICSLEHVLLTPKRDMRVLEGTLENLLERGKSDLYNEDYLLIRLTDTHAILDIMSKLREVYPNVLHLERPGLMGTGNQPSLHRDHLKRGEMSMFRDFFKQISGEELNPEQAAIVEETMEMIHGEEEA